MATRVVTAAELAQHSTRADCWTAIHGVVYDVTSFLDEHPGGAKVMLKYAGADSTKAFDMVRVASQQRVVGGSACVRGTISLRALAVCG